MLGAFIVKWAIRQNVLDYQTVGSTFLELGASAIHLADTLDFVCAMHVSRLDLGSSEGSPQSLFAHLDLVLKLAELKLASLKNKQLRVETLPIQI